MAPAAASQDRNAPVVVSASFAHPRVPAADRAPLSIHEDDLVEALSSVENPPAELVVISTCLRHEVYAVGLDEAAMLDLVFSMSRADSVPDGELRYGREAVTHLFHVAAGLHSPVVGEPEVLGQVRRAHKAAKKAGTIGPALDQVCREAIRAGREARDLLPEPDHGSLAKIAAEHLTDREPGRLVLVGAGQMAHAVFDHLDGTGWEVVRITRRPDRLGPGALGLDHLLDELIHADACVTAVRSPKPLLSAVELADLTAVRDRPLLLVDVGMPANVEECDVDGIVYEGVDRLASDHRHSVAIEEVTAVVDVRAVETHARVVNSSLTPLIVSLRQKAASAVEEELAKVYGKLEHLDDDDLAVVERLARTLANRLLHDPLLYLSTHPQATATSDTARHILGIPDE